MSPDLVRQAKRLAARRARLLVLVRQAAAPGPARQPDRQEARR